MPDSRDTEIEQIILKMLAERGPGKTICPSEAARRMAALAGSPDSWRDWMNQTRAIAAVMESRGQLLFLQHDQRINPETARGPVRLGLPRKS